MTASSFAMDITQVVEEPKKSGWQVVWTKIGDRVVMIQCVKRDVMGKVVSDRVEITPVNIQQLVFTWAKSKDQILTRTGAVDGWSVTAIADGNGMLNELMVWNADDLAWALKRRDNELFQLLTDSEKLQLNERIKEHQKMSQEVKKLLDSNPPKKNPTSTIP